MAKSLQDLTFITLPLATDPETNEKYYLLDDLWNEGLFIFSNYVSKRAFVKDRCQDNYVFRQYKDKEWIQSDGNAFRTDKIFLKEQWILDNVPEYSTTATYDIEYAPDVIVLSKNEKFTDKKNNTINITIYGLRNQDNCYFKGSDVSKYFGVNKLEEMLTNPANKYVFNEDYKYFIIKSQKDDVFKSAKKLVLSYKGLVKIISESSSRIGKQYQKWLVDNVFKRQYKKKERNINNSSLNSDMESIGSNLSKQISYDKITKSNSSECVNEEKSEKKENKQTKKHDKDNALSMTYDNLQKFFALNCSNSMSCIYFISLGTVKNQRKHMKIPSHYNDTHIVAKFGTIKENNYKKKHEYLNNCKTILLNYIWTDPEDIKLAKNDIKEKLADHRLGHKDKDFNKMSKEIIIISKNDLKFVREVYDNVSKKYSNTKYEYKNQINTLNNKLEQEVAKHRELDLQYKNELLMRDIQIKDLQHKTEMLMKDIQINEMSNMRNANKSSE